MIYRDELFCVGEMIVYDWIIIFWLVSWDYVCLCCGFVGFVCSLVLYVLFWWYVGLCFIIWCCVWFVVGCEFILCGDCCYVVVGGWFGMVGEVFIVGDWYVIRDYGV